MPKPGELKGSGYNPMETASNQGYGNTALSDAEAKQGEYRRATKRSFNLWRWLFDMEWQFMVDGDQPDDPSPATPAEPALPADRACEPKKK
jgi:hypothetical protein